MAAKLITSIKDVHPGDTLVSVFHGDRSVASGRAYIPGLGNVILTEDGGYLKAADARSGRWKVIPAPRKRGQAS